MELKNLLYSEREKSQYSLNISVECFIFLCQLLSLIGFIIFYIFYFLDGLRPSLSAAGKTDVTKVALSGDGSIGTYNQRRLNGGNRNEQPIPNDRNMDVQIVSNDDFIKRKTNNKGRSDIEQPVVDDQLGSNNVANGESNVIQSALKNGIVNGHQAANINDIVSQSTFNGSSVNKQSVSNGGTDNGLQIKIKQPGKRFLNSQIKCICIYISMYLDQWIEIPYSFIL